MSNEIDYKIFDRFVASLASEFEESDWTTMDRIRVFHCYFDIYRERMGHGHAPLKKEQIVEIGNAMPWVEIYVGEAGDENGMKWVHLTPAVYKRLIDCYFDTKFKKECNRNINHFFSGKIREMRCYDIGITDDADTEDFGEDEVNEQESQNPPTKQEVAMYLKEIGSKTDIELAYMHLTRHWDEVLPNWKAYVKTHWGQAA